MSNPALPDRGRLMARLGELQRRYIEAPFWAARLAAFVLESPATSSDAALLLADGFDEIADLDKSPIHGDVRCLAALLRNEAPRFARAARP